MPTAPDHIATCKEILIIVLAERSQCVESRTMHSLAHCFSLLQTASWLNAKSRIGFRSGSHLRPTVSTEEQQLEKSSRRGLRASMTPASNWHSVLAPGAMAVALPNKGSEMITFYKGFQKQR